MDTPIDVYLDTDVVVNCVIGGLVHSESCIHASSQLAMSGSTAWISQLLRVEFIQAVRSLATRGEVPPPLFSEFELENWASAEVRRVWLMHCWNLLGEYLESLPHVAELPISRSEIDLAVEMMARYALRSQDAVHLSTALHYELPLFWTCDDHFARVQEIAVEIIRDDPAQT